MMERDTALVYEIDNSEGVKFESYESEIGFIFLAVRSGPCSLHTRFTKEEAIALRDELDRTIQLMEETGG